VSSLSASERLSEHELVAPPAQLATAVSIQDLSVTYRAAVESRPTLRNRVVRMGRRQRTYREIEAVKRVSFDVPRGSVTGVIGVNGAGKSTLMRAVAGILPPTSGRIVVHGRVSTLLALGVGFNAQLSGRENVILGGLAAGLRRDQLAAKYDEIAAFAELGDFMDLPMRTYSSGMYGRLAFSVAVNMDPDILLVDEALSVGDARFKRKSLRRMRRLCDQAGTILIVSHALRTIRDLCTDVAWMHKGELVMFDKADVVTDAYREFMEGDDGDDDEAAMEEVEDAAAMEDL
jgi:teichoic acid transport system ATP-binding protein